MATTTIAGNMVQGVIVGLVVAIVLALSHWCYVWYLERVDVRQVREVLSEGRQRVMEARDTLNSVMGVTFAGDVLRAGQYNLLLKQLGVVLDPVGSKLSYRKRKEIFDALDWYNVGALHAIKDKEGNPVFHDPPVGRWIAAEMRHGDASRKFQRLESIRWLKLEPYSGGS